MGYHSVGTIIDGTLAATEALEISQRIWAATDT
jgi:hypothetical protein